MPLNSFKLIEKNKLTSDIYELTFQVKDKFDFKPGQFVTFILPNIGGRAYSILKTQGKNITLIIKSRSSNNGGRGGSEYICNREVGEELKGTNPAGRFLLQNNNKNKLFIGTGTGFVPLYNQIIHALEDNQSGKLELLFGARKLSDLFYITQLENIKNNNSNFDYKVYLSREENTTYNSGYVTDYLTNENINKYEEFYICGIPALINSGVDILEKSSIDKVNILTEKY